MLEHAALLLIMSEKHYLTDNKLILFSKDGAASLFMAIGNEGKFVLIEQLACSPLLVCLFELVNNLLLQWWLSKQACSIADISFSSTCSNSNRWTTVVASSMLNNTVETIMNNIVRPRTLFVQQHCSFNNIVRSTTLFVQQHCSFNNIVCSTTLFVQQHCSFNNIVPSITMFVQQHCSFNNIVRSTTLFVQQYCLFNNIARSTTLFSHDNRVVTPLFNQQYAVTTCTYLNQAIAPADSSWSRGPPGGQRTNICTTTEELCLKF